METITLIPPNTTHQFKVPYTESGQRLDLYLKQRFSSYSRNFLQQLIAKVDYRTPHRDYNQTIS